MPWARGRHNGPGAVLGAKRLKAIAVARGSKPVPVHDAEGLGRWAEEMVARVRADPMWGQTYQWATAPVWDRMLENYYELMGWDSATGKPLPETLAMAGLDSVVTDLGR